MEVSVYLRRDATKVHNNEQRAKDRRVLLQVQGGVGKIVRREYKKEPDNEDRCHPTRRKATVGKDKEESRDGCIPDHLDGFDKPIESWIGKSNPAQTACKGRGSKCNQHDRDEDGKRIVWFADEDEMAQVVNVTATRMSRAMVRVTKEATEMPTRFNAFSPARVTWSGGHDSVLQIKLRCS